MYVVAFKKPNWKTKQINCFLTNLITLQTLLMKNYAICCKTLLICLEFSLIVTHATTTAISYSHNFTKTSSFMWATYMITFHKNMCTWTMNLRWLSVSPKLSRAPAIFIFMSPATTIWHRMSHKIMKNQWKTLNK